MSTPALVRDKVTSAQKKALGLAACTALIMGNMVGSGFYVSPASLAPYGLLAIVSWIVMGVGAVCLGLVFARLAHSYPATGDRKSTRLNSSHTVISYAVFCLKK